MPHRIGRHVHAKARPDETAPPPTPSGIDYLRLVEAAHAAELAQTVRYSQLTPDRVPGQMAMPDTDEGVLP